MLIAKPLVLKLGDALSWGAHKVHKGGVSDNEFHLSITWVITKHED